MMTEPEEQHTAEVIGREVAFHCARVRVSLFRLSAFLDHAGAHSHLWRVGGAVREGIRSEIDQETRHLRECWLVYRAMRREWFRLREEAK